MFYVSDLTRPIAFIPDGMNLGNATLKYGEVI
jgi:hypothetical protein